MPGGVAYREPTDAHVRPDAEGIPSTHAAWIAALVCVAALAGVIAWLGPTIARAVHPTPTLKLLPGDTGRLTPEPGESTNYLLAVLAAMLLVLVTAVLARLRPLGLKRTRTAVVTCGQVLAVGLVVACLIAQHTARWEVSYFTLTSVLVASAIVAGVTFAVRRDWAGGLELRMPTSRAWRALLWIVPLAATAIWLLPAINTERSIAWAPLSHDTAFHFDESFAVLNGLTPLADFNAQYASLFPYAIALSMLVLGKTLLVFTTTVCALSLLALMAIYGVLRRAAGRPELALLLFLPFMATSLFNPTHFGVVRLTPGTYFAMLPFRYGGPYLLAWLVARHLEQPRRSRVWLLFGVAGLVILNNFEFGIAAFGATVASLLWTDVELRPRRLGRLAVSAGAGLGMAVIAYAAFTIVRAGSLPDIGRMPQFARLYGLAGYSVAPMPGTLGVPLVIYLTYVAALATATVRAIDRAPNRVLTGMLAWSGIFGLGAATYWVARSDSVLLSMMFSAWAFALALLAIAVLQGMAAAPRRRPRLAALAVLFGIGLAACSLAQLPLPWDELHRVQTKPAGAPAVVSWAYPPPREPESRVFVSSIGDGRNRFVVRHGAPVALFSTTGHRIADAYGIADVVPFTGTESMHTLAELEEALDALLKAGGNTLLLQAERVPGLHEALERRGFRLLTASGVHVAPIGRLAFPSDLLIVDGLTKWVDMRHPRAAWLG